MNLKVLSIIFLKEYIFVGQEEENTPQKFMIISLKGLPRNNFKKCTFISLKGLKRLA